MLGGNVTSGRRNKTDLKSFFLVEISRSEEIYFKITLAKTFFIESSLPKKLGQIVSISCI